MYVNGGGAASQSCGGPIVSSRSPLFVPERLQQPVLASTLIMAALPEELEPCRGRTPCRGSCIQEAQKCQEENELSEMSSDYYHVHGVEWNRICYLGCFPFPTS